MAEKKQTIPHHKIMVETQIKMQRNEEKPNAKCLCLHTAKR